MQAQGRATPLDEKVPMSDAAIWFIKQFQLLSTERSFGMGVGPIPINRIVEYSKNFLLIGSFEEFITVMLALDSAFLENDAKKRKAKQDKLKRQNRTK